MVSFRSEIRQTSTLVLRKSCLFLFRHIHAQDGSLGTNEQFDRTKIWPRMESFTVLVVSFLRLARLLPLCVYIYAIIPYLLATNSIYFSRSSQGVLFTPFILHPLFGDITLLAKAKKEKDSSPDFIDTSYPYVNANPAFRRLRFRNDVTE